MSKTILSHLCRGLRSTALPRKMSPRHLKCCTCHIESSPCPKASPTTVSQNAKRRPSSPNTAPATQNDLQKHLSFWPTPTSSGNCLACHAWSNPRPFTLTVRTPQCGHIVWWIWTIHLYHLSTIGARGQDILTFPDSKRSQVLAAEMVAMWSVSSVSPFELGATWAAWLGAVGDSSMVFYILHQQWKMEYYEFLSSIESIDAFSEAMDPRIG